MHGKYNTIKCYQFITYHHCKGNYFLDRLNIYFGCVVGIVLWSGFQLKTNKNKKRVWVTVNNKRSHGCIEIILHLFLIQTSHLKQLSLSQSTKYVPCWFLKSILSSLSSPRLFTFNLISPLRASASTPYQRPTPVTITDNSAFGQKVPIDLDPTNGRISSWPFSTPLASYLDSLATFLHPFTVYCYPSLFCGRKEEYWRITVRLQWHVGSGKGIGVGETTKGGNGAEAVCRGVRGRLGESGDVGRGREFKEGRGE